MSKNHLHTSTSPYLLQHANNPVYWHPWRNAAFKEAKEQNKLLIISIGYAACHWCHVMEHESFEDKEVARVMNDNYISIKVDREERPDVDQVYINAVQLMTGRAGWPLNVVALPNGKPIWGGTYFKKKEWIQALTKIENLHKKNPSYLLEQAEKVTQGIQQMDALVKADNNSEFKNFSTDSIITKFKRNFDLRNGGFNRAPKFMMPNNWLYLLQQGVSENDTVLKEHVLFTLEQMAYGGIYDAVGGGFSRYSVDEKWHIPHFEKMLYDNAQLVSLYAEAYAMSNNHLFKEVVDETLKFISVTLTSPEGLFYSSLDADSLDKNGILKEGAYYTFSKQELQTIIQEDFPIFEAYYNINEWGYWEEGQYVLNRNLSDAAIAEEYGLTVKVFQQKKKHWRKTLLGFRNKRSLPRLDDKILTSWNALMITGFAKAYQKTTIKTYKEIAIRAANELTDKVFTKGGRLFHAYKKEAHIEGFLEDYAFAIEALIELYFITFNEDWLQRAKNLTEITIEEFYDTTSGMFLFNSKSSDQLVSNPIEYRDNVIPASNSCMAHNLHTLGTLFAVDKYIDIATQQLRNVAEEMENYPSGFSNWLRFLKRYNEPFKQIAIVGPDAFNMASKIQQMYLPSILLAASLTSSKLPLLKDKGQKGETLLYLCEGKTCQLPVNTVKEILKLINQKI